MKLYAVDPLQTRIREDGFMVEFDDENPQNFRVIIASVIPEGVTVERKAFPKNFLKEAWDKSPHYFISQKEREALSLNGTTPQAALFLAYRFLGDEVTTEVGVAEATATPYTYEEFMRESRKFKRIQSRLQELIFQDPFIDLKYRARISEGVWNNDVNPCSKLIFGLLELFNKEMSRIAYKLHIPTLRLPASRQPSFDVYNGRARFSAPLRRAAAYVNSYNFAAHLRGEQLIARKYLEEIGCLNSDLQRRAS